MDELCKNLASECEKKLLLEDKEHRHRNRKGKLSENGIMTILVCYHLGSFANFQALLPLLHKAAPFWIFS